MIKKLLINFAELIARLIVEKDYDLPHQLNVRATQEAVNFYHDNMPNTQVFTNKKQMIDFELECVKNDGLYLEFGVAKAVHTNYIASKIKQNIHGFDSFRGFPESWNGTSKSFHNYEGVIPKVVENVILHDGWFKDTLPKFVENNNEKIAYLNIDCDLYSSTKTVFDSLGDKISSGTIIHFDEYLNFPDWKNHEYKAFMEFVKSNNIEFEYIAIGPKGMVAVKIK